MEVYVLATDRLYHPGVLSGPGWAMVFPEDGDAVLAIVEFGQSRPDLVRRRAVIALRRAGFLARPMPTARLHEGWWLMGVHVREPVPAVWCRYPGVPTPPKDAQAVTFGEELLDLDGLTRRPFDEQVVVLRRAGHTIYQISRALASSKEEVRAVVCGTVPDEDAVLSAAHQVFEARAVEMGARIDPRPWWE